MVDFEVLQKMRAMLENGDFSREDLSPKTATYAVQFLLGVIDQYQAMVQLALNDLNQVAIQPVIISATEAKLKQQLAKALDPMVDPRNSQE